MPRKAKSNPAEELRITEALQALQNGDCKNFADTLQQFTVLYYKLRSRHLGANTKANNSSYNKTLSDEQEKALILYMQRCRALGRPPTRQYTKTAARALLRLSNSLNTITKDWWRGWKKQYKHLYKYIKTKLLSAEYKAAVQQIEIQVYFQDFYC
jgi:hypothetical protein